jgi:hypothetical protein
MLILAVILLSREIIFAVMCLMFIAIVVLLGLERTSAPPWVMIYAEPRANLAKCII